MVKLTVRDRESIQEAVRRFRKLVERSGIKKEMRRREFLRSLVKQKRRASSESRTSNETKSIAGRLIVTRPTHGEAAPCLV